MSSPFNFPPEIEEAIIDILAEDDRNHTALKSCALVCRGFLPICRKHIFNSIALNQSSIALHPTIQLQRLLLSSPGIADYIRKLEFCIQIFDLENRLVSESLKLIPRLESLYVWHGNSYYFDWGNNPLRSTILHLLHLPTIIHFKVATMRNFVVSDLIPCTNLKSLHLGYDMDLAASTTFPTDFPNNSVTLDSFITSWTLNAKALVNLFAHRPDGQWVIDFSSMSTCQFSLKANDVPAAQKLFAQCKMLVNVDIRFDRPTVALPSLADMLRPSMRTLKNLAVYYSIDTEDADPLFGLASELEMMRAENIIENLNISIFVHVDRNCSCGDEWGGLDQVLSRPGWLWLKRVSLEVKVASYSKEPRLEGLRKLPETRFVHLSSSSDIVFNFNVKSQLV